MLIHRGGGPLYGLDVSAWAKSAGIWLSEDSEKAFVSCPWSSEHAGGVSAPADTVVYFNSDTRVPGFHCLHAHCAARSAADLLSKFGPESFAPFLPPPASDPASAAPVLPGLPESDPIDRHIQFLGVTRENVFVVKSSDGHFPVFFAPHEVSQKWLYSLYSDEGAWMSSFPKIVNGNCVGIHVESAAQWLFSGCKRAGCFENRSFNELGLWKDHLDGTSCHVLNLGNGVYSGGVRYAYEDANRIFRGYYTPSETKITLSGSPATRELAGEQLMALRRLCFSGVDQAVLFYGGLLASMCPGISPEIPIVELNGPPASGKTVVLDKVADPMYKAGGGIHLTSGSTVAGTLQSISGNVSVILDEHEPGGLANQTAIDGINDIALASTTGGASISKGTTRQHAIKRNFRCGWIFGSVGNTTDKKETLSRRTLSITLVAPSDDYASWKSKEDGLTRWFSPENCRAVYRYIVDNIGLIRYNIDRLLTFISARNPNLPLAASTLYAIPAAYLVTLLSHSEADVSRDKWIIDVVMRSLSDAYADKEDRNLISFGAFSEKLLTLKIREGTSEYQIQELISSKDGYSNDDMLGRNGLKVRDAAGKKMLLLANNHPVLTKLMEDAGIYGYTRILKSMPNAVRMEPAYFLKIKKRSYGIMLSDLLREEPPAAKPAVPSADVIGAVLEGLK